MISELSKTEIQQFIEEHLYDDPYQLMLQAEKYASLPLQQVVEQIQAKRKAKTKLPQWFSTSGIVYPPAVSMEQCSSEETALFKASLVNGQSMVDLTGGFGIDTFYLSDSFEESTYVERYAHLADMARHNFGRLDRGHIKCLEGQAEVFLSSMTSRVDLIYLDPARRSAENRKVVLLSDCEPDVTSLLPDLLKKARKVMIKTSPMLDIKGALTELRYVSEVHVVAVRNDVKELLFILDAGGADEPIIHCHNLRGKETEYFRFTFNQEQNTEVKYEEVGSYLYEPNATILKAGGFNSIAAKHCISKLHPNTHLYTANEIVPSFPGRVFQIKEKITLNKKNLRKHLPDKKAQIKVRNFPMTVDQIRRKSGLKEGGEHFLFGLTDIKGAHLLLAEKTN